MSDRKEQILDAAEDLLRRYGVAKTTVTDVARALGLSHAAVYKYFDTKAALQEAVAERWLARVSTPLGAIASGNGTAEKKLRDWMRTLVEIKRRKVLDDPEMFGTYHALAETAGGAVSRHVEELERQLAHIIREGMESGDFRVSDARNAAVAVFNATARFHHPHFVRQTPPQDADVTAVLDLLVAGLASPRSKTSGGAERQTEPC